MSAGNIPEEQNVPQKSEPKRYRFDHAYEPGAYQVCRRCGHSFDEHKQGYYIP